MSTETSEKQKVCKDCPVETGLQPVSNFYKHKTNTDGRQEICKPCYKVKYSEPKKAKKQADPFRAFFY